VFHNARGTGFRTHPVPDVRLDIYTLSPCCLFLSLCVPRLACCPSLPLSRGIRGSRFSLAGLSACLSPVRVIQTLKNSFQVFIRLSFKVFHMKKRPDFFRTGDRDLPLRIATPLYPCSRYLSVSLSSGARDERAGRHEHARIRAHYQQVCVCVRVCACVCVCARIRAHYQQALSSLSRSFTSGAITKMAHFSWSLTIF
jgi:hypothetical protein